MLSSAERLDLNVSTTFVELLLSTLNHLGRDQEHVLQRDRGSVAPYKIRNHTGTSVLVWTDDDGSSGVRESSSVEIKHGETVDWRFDDWKTMREVCGLTS
jgi:vacuolar protein sorting-associated protein 13A/C